MNNRKNIIGGLNAEEKAAILIRNRDTMCFRKKQTNHEPSFLMERRACEYGIPHPGFGDHHLVNCTLEDLEGLKLYKFLPINILKVFLSTSSIYLDRIQTWDDPYENYFLKEKFVMESSGGRVPIVVESMIPALFGQSWTTTAESDALWRIYSGDCQSVRIEISARRLLEIMYVSDDSMANLWMGRVDYTMDEVQLNEDAQRQFADGKHTDVWQKYMPLTLFRKRNPFEHEQEFRVVQMFDTLTMVKLRDFERIRFAVDDLCAAIDSVVFDPRLGEEQYKERKKEIVALGVGEGKVYKSGLYSFEPVTIVMK